MAPASTDLTVNEVSQKIIGRMAFWAWFKPSIAVRLNGLHAALPPEKLIKEIAGDSELLSLLVTAFAHKLTPPDPETVRQCVNILRSGASSGTASSPASITD